MNVYHPMRLCEEVQATPPFSIVVQDNTQGFWLEWAQNLDRRTESLKLKILSVV